MYAHAGTGYSQKRSAALSVTETNFSFVPELYHGSNHLEYEGFHSARIDCAVCFSQFNVNYINLAVITLR